MKHVVIVHGHANNSQGNWFPWLKVQLKNKGYKVSVPDFPSSNSPQLKTWLKTLKIAIGDSSQDTILIGHSLGTITILHYLQQLSRSIKLPAVILVAGFAIKDFKIKIPEIDNFFIPKLKWSEIRQTTKKFYIINSDNDRYIPLSNANLLAKNLKQKLILIKGEDHFNLTSSPKYKKFPYVLKLFDRIK